MEVSVLAPQFSGSIVSFTQNRADHSDKAVPSELCSTNVSDVHAAT